MTRTCIIHYSNQNSYSKVKPLSQTNKERIRQAKDLRESLGGTNLRPEQCETIPDQFVEGFHGVPLEPCYKK